MTSDDHRLLTILEQLFELVPAPTPIDLVLGRCADLIAAATNAEKVDCFVYEAPSKTLVAIGTARTELARLQINIGLNRLPLANHDPMAQVFETGEIYHSGCVERDERQPRGVIETLGIRSMVAAPLDVGGVRRGVLSLASTRPDAFSVDEVSMLKVVAVWVGNLLHRSELLELSAARATEQGRRAAAEELVTVLAHDLRNLLAPIGARAATMLERANRDQRADDVKDGKRMLASIARLGELVSDLLDVARIEQGMMVLDYQRVGLVALLRACGERLALPDVDIQVDSYTSEVNLLGDPRRLLQVFDNVLSNATRHSPRGVPVMIQIRPAELEVGGAVAITIVDQGHGIAPDLLPRIFERYVSSGRGSGLGLGLYLSRAVIAAHGGVINLTSTAAQGTRCEIVLPLPPERDSLVT